MTLLIWGAVVWVLLSIPVSILIGKCVHSDDDQ